MSSSIPYIRNLSQKSNLSIHSLLQKQPFIVMPSSVFLYSYTFYHVICLRRSFAFSRLVFHTDISYHWAQWFKIKTKPTLLHTIPYSNGLMIWILQGERYLETHQGKLFLQVLIEIVSQRCITVPRDRLTGCHSRSGVTYGKLNHIAQQHRTMINYSETYHCKIPH